MPTTDTFNSDHVSMELSNHAKASITCIDREGAEAGFMVRIFEPWATYPGEPSAAGGYADGTGTNHDCVWLTVTFGPNGEPEIETLRVDGRHYRPIAEAYTREARERVNSAAEVRKRKLAEADSLTTRANMLRAQAGEI